MEQEQIVKHLKDARDDHDAILGGLGALAYFTATFRMLAEERAQLLLGPASELAMPIADGLTRSAKSLERARIGFGEILEYLGDVLNGCDACSETGVNLSAPVYEMFRKRSAGVTLDD